MRVCRATLDNPSTLNALSSGMVHALEEHLAGAASRPEVAAIFLEGSGTRAFCSGGDIREAHARMVRSPRQADPDMTEFLRNEYRLCRDMHTFPKPVIAWGSGIVMGGGFGLLHGCSHRVATETSRFAMPECGIGFYPDVGGTWFLNCLPAGAGLFLALTGHAVNGAEALSLGLADRTLAESAREGVWEAMTRAEWHGERDRNDAVVVGILRSATRAPELPDGLWTRHANTLTRIVAESGAQAPECIVRYGRLHAEMGAVCASVESACPLSIEACLLLIDGKPPPTRAECASRELALSTAWIATGEFTEGIRARLIDRDRSPAWNPPRRAAARELAAILVREAEASPSDPGPARW